MAFIIKKQDILKDHKEFSKTFTHDTGFQITFRSVATPAFQKVYALISQKMDKDVELTAKTIDGIDETLSPDEAIGYAIAKHLIVDWDLATEEDGKLEITGENFAMLATQLESPQDFVYWCFNCATQVANEIAQKHEKIKKKQSKGGNGSKSTTA